MTSPVERTVRPLLRRAYQHSSVRFLAVSGLGYALDLSLLLALQAICHLPRTANVSIAFWATYAVNFLLNRTYAFRAAPHDLPGQLRRYLPQVLADFTLTLGGVELLTGLLAIPLITARMLAAATNAVFNYSAYRWWTFRAENTAPR